MVVLEPFCDMLMSNCLVIPLWFHYLTMDGILYI